MIVVLITNDKTLQHLEKKIIIHGLVVGKYNFYKDLGGSNCNGKLSTDWTK